MKTLCMTISIWFVVISSAQVNSVTIYAVTRSINSQFNLIKK